MLLRYSSAPPNRRSGAAAEGTRCIVAPIPQEQLCAGPDRGPTRRSVGRPERAPRGNRRPRLLYPNAEVSLGRSAWQGGLHGATGEQLADPSSIEVYLWRSGLQGRMSPDARRCGAAGWPAALPRHRRRALRARVRPSYRTREPAVSPRSRTHTRPNQRRRRGFRPAAPWPAERLRSEQNEGRPGGRPSLRSRHTVRPRDPCSGRSGCRSRGRSPRTGAPLPGPRPPRCCFRPRRCSARPPRCRLS
jgi:hypothetical protein